MMTMNADAQHAWPSPQAEAVQAARQRQHRASRDALIHSCLRKLTWIGENSMLFGDTAPGKAETTSQTLDQSIADSTSSGWTSFRELHLKDLMFSFASGGF